MTTRPLDPSLATYVEALVTSGLEPAADRREPLDALVAAITEQRAGGGWAQVTFVCTHNSRRSHLGQIWAATAAWYFAVDRIATFSGGTERTAVAFNLLDALERAGFTVDRGTEAENPTHRITFAPDVPALPCFSKLIDDPPNPEGDFTAVMTCSQANESCPVVHGATRRVALTYEDPKVADGTADAARIYDERCREIAREMLYVASRL